MPGTTRRVIVLTAWAVYLKPDLSILVVDLGLTGLPNVVGIDTVRIVIPRLKVPLIFKSRPHAPQPSPSFLAKLILVAFPQAVACAGWLCAYDLTSGCPAVEAEDLIQPALVFAEFCDHAPGFGPAAGGRVYEHGFADAGQPAQ